MRLWDAPAGSEIFLWCLGEGDDRITPHRRRLLNKGVSIGSRRRPVGVAPIRLPAGAGT
jgi:hypothetical protein